MITYVKQRQLETELKAARSTSDDLTTRITADDVVAYSDLTGTPSQLNQLFYQATAPSHSTVACVASTVSSGDYWIDSDDSKMYQSDGSTWAEIIGLGDGTAAQALLDDIADDAKITAVEKLTLKPMWDAIVTEATLTTGTLIVQAAAVSVADADFDAAYAALYGYIITSLDVFDDMAATTTIVRATWDGHWNLYWDERTNLINDIELAVTAAAFSNSIAVIDAQVDITELGFDSSGNLITSVLPASNVTPDGTGLYLGADYLGYYSSGAWITYLDNSGNFYLGGTSGALQWNGSTLSIVGSINITGTSTVGQLLQVNSAGTIRSNSTGAYPYIEMSNAGIQLKDSDTGGTVGTAVVNTDVVGFGATVWIMNADYDIPWMETKEPQDASANDVTSIRLFERDADPTGGTYIQGDLANTSGFLKSYYNSGWRTQCMILSTTAASSGVGSVKMGSVNAADSAGWIEIDTNKFVPYWTDETP